MEIAGNWYGHYYGDDYSRLVKSILTPERTDAEVMFILGATKIPKTAKIVDIACGEGRHSLAFAKQGLDVLGLDLNEKFIEKARQEAKAAKIKAKFTVQDMRRPIGAGYDLALSAYNSFGFFSDEENEKMAADWVKCLKKGGLFLMDVWNRDAMVLKYRPSRTWPLEDEGEVAQTSVYDHVTGRVMTRYVFRAKNGDAREYMASFRMYTASELCGLLRRAGLEIVELFGSLSGGPYEWKSDRLVALARK